MLNTQTDELFLAISGGGPAIEVLYGMIGSGKSGFARERSKHGAVIVCLDSLATSLHPGGEHTITMEDGYHKIEKTIAVEAIKAGHRVVVDRTHLTQKSRHPWYDLADELKIPVIAVRFAFTHPKEHARRRFEADPRGLALWQWETIAYRHQAQAIRSPFEGYGPHGMVDYVFGSPVGDPFKMEARIPEYRF